MKTKEQVYLIDITKERAEEFMDDPVLVSIEESDRTGWMTEMRIKDDMRSKDHEDVEIVQIRHGDSDWCTGVSIEDWVVVNRFADMIVTKETYSELVNSDNNLYNSNKEYQEELSSGRELYYIIEDDEDEEYQRSIVRPIEPDVDLTQSMIPEEPYVVKIKINTSDAVKDSISIKGVVEDE